ncbi:Phage integrase family protein [Roseomonas rosea]|uniref:Phage integrase family protein n=1 Tax=Muricoccus roseus TaxID=198092 RepID=A0A1M6RIR5_9PROT|nr:tyrosine-type recombinase/integrase [Roseomonas rosea]SHK32258.1 Phage integrase family protein [Roseomonas rosea]
MLRRRAILDSIDISTPGGLRDRALIALMIYSLARIGAALAMKVEDAYIEKRRFWVRLHEKGVKEHAMPCHHTLEEYLYAYIDGCGLAHDPKGRCSKRSHATAAQGAAQGSSHTRLCDRATLTQ